MVKIYEDGRTFEYKSCVMMSCFIVSLIVAVVLVW